MPITAEGWISLAPTSRGLPSPERENRNARFSAAKFLSDLIGNDLTSLSSSRRRQLQIFWGPVLLEELLSLAQEGNPELFFEHLFDLAAKTEREDLLPASMEAYADIIAAARNGMAGVSAALVRRAQERVDAIRGGGEFGPRFEFLGRRLIREATDPAAIFAMGAAGIIARGVRLAAMSRLLSSPTRHFFSAGMRANAASHAIAFGAETLGFTASSRLAHAALGRPQSWDSQGLLCEYAAGAVSLLGLRLMGFLAGVAVRPVSGSPGLLAGLWRTLAPQAGLYGGVLLAHRMEQALGWREHASNATTLIDAFAQYLNFVIAGQLSRHIFGEGVGQTRLLSALARESRDPGPWLGLPDLGSPRGPLFARSWALAGPAQQGPEPTRRDTRHIFLSVKTGDENSGEPNPSLPGLLEGQVPSLPVVEEFLTNRHRWNLSRPDLEAMDRPEFDPRPLLREFRQDAVLRGLLTQRVGELEPIDLESHTAMVLENFEKFFARGEFPGSMRRSTFRLMLLVHDAGKPLAIRSGDKHLQHGINSVFLRSLFRHWGVDEFQSRLALALLNCRIGGAIRIFRRSAQMQEAFHEGNQSLLGKFETRIRGNYGLPADFAEQVIQEFRIPPHRSPAFETHAQEAARQIILRDAEKAGIAPIPFYDLAVRYHQVDAGAWTTFANGGKVQIPGESASAFDDMFVFGPGGNRVSYHPYVESQMAQLRRSISDLASP